MFFFKSFIYLSFFLFFLLFFFAPFFPSFFFSSHSSSFFFFFLYFFSFLFFLPFTTIGCRRDLPPSWTGNNKMLHSAWTATTARKRQHHCLKPPPSPPLLSFNLGFNIFSFFIFRSFLLNFLDLDLFCNRILYWNLESGVWYNQIKFFYHWVLVVSVGLL